MTICIECVYCSNRIPSAYPSNHRCLLQKREEQNVDSVTGMILYKSELDTQTGNKYPECSEVNNGGKCTLFEPTEEVDTFDNIKEFLDKE